jgi:integrase
MLMTPKSVERIKPQTARAEYTDDNYQPLKLVVQPSGAKSWAVRYWFGKTEPKKRKLTIGSFPAISLAAAREAARKAIETAQCGTDPCAVKKLGTPAEASFDAAADLYTAKHVAELRNGTQAYVKRELQAARNEFMGRTLASITKRDLIALIDHADESGPHAGTQRRKVLAAFFRWAHEDRDLIQSNPARGLPKRQFKARDRFLDDGELRIVWQAADKEAGRYGALVKLLVLTGCRRNEIARLTWDEIQGDYIVLAPDRTKTAEAHRVFITPLMRSIIDTLPRRGVYVLGNGKPMSANCYAKDCIDVTLNEPWRFHDLRRSFATGLQRCGVPVEIIERCLNHKLAGIQAVYNRHDYTDECRDAFDKWSAHIEAITALRPNCL